PGELDIVDDMRDLRGDRIAVGVAPQFGAAFEVKPAEGGVAGLVGDEPVEDGAGDRVGGVVAMQPGELEVEPVLDADMRGDIRVQMARRVERLAVEAL